MTHADRLHEAGPHGAINYVEHAPRTSGTCA